MKTAQSPNHMLYTLGNSTSGTVKFQDGVPIQITVPNGTQINLVSLVDSQLGVDISPPETNERRVFAIPLEQNVSQRRRLQTSTTKYGRQVFKQRRLLSPSRSHVISRNKICDEPNFGVWLHEMDLPDLWVTDNQGRHLKPQFLLDVTLQQKAQF